MPSSQPAAWRTGVVPGASCDGQLSDDWSSGSEPLATVADPIEARTLAATPQVRRRRPGAGLGGGHAPRLAGKRLYTNADGGRIINRFFPSFTEHPAFDDFARASATTPAVQELKLFPYGNGQSRQG